MFMFQKGRSGRSHNHVLFGYSLFEMVTAILSSLGICTAKPQGGGMVSLFPLNNNKKEILFNELELTSLLIY